MAVEMCQANLKDFSLAGCRQCATYISKVFQ